MLNFFEYFNIFSQTPSLRVNGKNKPFSIFGILVGMIAISIMIIAYCFILIDYFSRISFSITSYTDNLAMPDISLKDFKIGFQLLNHKGIEFPEADRVFQITAVWAKIKIPFLGDNTESISQISRFVPIIKCDKYSNDSLFAKNFADYSKKFKYLQCLDIPKLNRTISGSYGNLGE